MNPHKRTSRRQPQRNRSANASPRAGDERNAMREIHVVDRHRVTACQFLIVGDEF